MWPFTSRRIMGNRWWALAFVAYVCWQAIDLIGETPHGNGSGNAVTTDATGANVSDDQLRNVMDALTSTK